MYICSFNWCFQVFEFLVKSRIGQAIISDLLQNAGIYRYNTRIRHATTYLLDVGVYIRTTYFYSNNFNLWNTWLNWTVNKRGCDRSFDQGNHQVDRVWFHRICKWPVLSNHWSIPILERFLQALFRWQTWWYWIHC